MLEANIVPKADKIPFAAYVSLSCFCLVGWFWSLTTKKPLIYSLFCKWGNRDPEKGHDLSKFPRESVAQLGQSSLLILFRGFYLQTANGLSLCKHIILESGPSFPYLGPDLLSMGKGRK